MEQKLSDLQDYYAQNPSQFIEKTKYSRFCIIFWLLFIILGYFIHPIISIIGIILFPLFLRFSRQYYYYNLKTNRKIVSVLHESFENYLMNKDEIIDCFLSKRFVRLTQLLNEPEDLSYASHDFPDDQEDIDQLSAKERSYFDCIHLEIDKEEHGQKYYCMLWQEIEYPKDDQDFEIGLTDVMILEHGDYLTLNTLIEPENSKNKQSSSIIS